MKFFSLFCPFQLKPTVGCITRQKSIQIIEGTKAHSAPHLALSTANMKMDKMLSKQRSAGFSLGWSGTDAKPPRRSPHPPKLREPFSHPPQPRARARIVLLNQLLQKLGSCTRLPTQTHNQYNAQTLCADRQNRGAVGCDRQKGHNPFSTRS